MKSSSILLLLLSCLFVSCSKDSPTTQENILVLPQVLTNPLNDVSIHSITISGNLVNTGNSAITETGFVLGNVTMPTVNHNLSKTIAQVDENGNFSVTYQSIPSNTELHFRAYAINAQGVGYGNEIVFTTLPQNIYNGNVTLTTQQEVIDFGQHSYTTINGSLNINGNISDLSPLNSLVIVNNGFEVKNTALINFDGLNNLRITGNVFANGFTIMNNSLLENFSGLENLLETRGDFVVLNNSSLINFNGLSNYKYVSAGELRIGLCNNLTSLSGLNNLVYVGSDLLIGDNSKLIDISALSNLTHIDRRIYFQGNAVLPNLIGLENITTLEGIFIESNGSLITLNGLNNLISCQEIITINNNDNLTDLSALHKINSVDYLNIQNNDSLNNLQGLDGITTITNILEIYNNSSLMNLNGLDNLLTVSYIKINSNNSILDLTGLNSLKTITGTDYALDIINNPNLTSLNGLESLVNSTGYIQIFQNNNLDNFCGLKNLFSTSLNFSLNVSNNLSNPSRQEVINNCN